MSGLSCGKFRLVSQGKTTLTHSWYPSHQLTCVCVCVCVCAQGLCVYLWDLYMCVQDPLCVCVCVVCVCVCIHSQPDHYSLWSGVCRHVWVCVTMCTFSKKVTVYGQPHCTYPFMPCPAMQKLFWCMCTWSLPPLPSPKEKKHPPTSQSTNQWLKRFWAGYHSVHCFLLSPWKFTQSHSLPSVRFDWLICGLFVQLVGLFSVLCFDWLFCGFFLAGWLGCFMCYVLIGYFVGCLAGWLSCFPCCDWLFCGLLGWLVGLFLVLCFDWLFCGLFGWLVRFFSVYFMVVRVLFCQSGLHNMLQEEVKMVLPHIVFCVLHGCQRKWKWGCFTPCCSDEIVNIYEPSVEVANYSVSVTNGFVIFTDGLVLVWSLFPVTWP